jgi:hypothetical protein
MLLAAIIGLEALDKPSTGIPEAQFTISKNMGETNHLVVRALLLYTPEVRVLAR